MGCWKTFNRHFREPKVLWFHGLAAAFPERSQYPRTGTDCRRPFCRSSWINGFLIIPGRLIISMVQTHFRISAEKQILSDLFCPQSIRIYCFRRFFPMVFCPARLFQWARRSINAIIWKQEELNEHRTSFLADRVRCSIYA